MFCEKVFGDMKIDEYQKEWTLFRIEDRIYKCKLEHAKWK